MRQVGAALAAVALVACSSKNNNSSAPTPYVPPPASTVVDDPGPMKIRREISLIDGVTPPPNPNGNKATPAEQNKVRVVRYRVDADPPLPARAIVVMMPGFQAGAGAVDGIARAIVRRSTTGDALEAWAIDRRSNLLEDTWGTDVAEVRQDPQQARDYYWNGKTVEGKTFGGFLAGPESPWASEWGIATTVGDLHNVIAKIPQSDRATRTILLGHSLGGGVATEYAAWDFGAPGAADLAGLVLVDPVTGNEGKPPSTVDRTLYENGKGPTQPGVVADIRNGATFYALPFLGTKALAVAEIVSMASFFSPTSIDVDPDRDSVASVLLSVSGVPKMTNLAAFGVAFDDDSMPIPILQVKCGTLTGGAVGSYQSVLGGKAVHPTDPKATYDWITYDKTNPTENTSLVDFARAWFQGPNLNLGEWYFPQRLSADVGAAITINIADDDWRSSVYGIKAKYGAKIDVPILGVGSYLVTDVAQFDGLKAIAAPIRAGLPSGGKARTDPDAFTATLYPELSHVDVVAGADVPGSKVGAWYDQVTAFVRKATPTGGVAVPVLP
jgi:pimeloyl-ACP methyl ester carboxylesterase